MKKFLAFLLLAVMILTLVGCGSKTETDTTTTDTKEDGAKVVLLISAAGTLDDRAFNSACWAGIQEVCAKNNLTYNYYQPTEDTVEAQLAQCDVAVAAGAEFIIINSDQFKLSAVSMENNYPDVTFLMYDTPPTDESGNVVINSNMKVITFAEEQCAYIAGYAAVKDGYTKIGYIGGMPVPAVVRFGYGFVEGINQACEDLGIDKVDVWYTYFGNFEATAANQTLCASWYEAGIQTIFVAAGPAGASAFAAAEATTDGTVIGVDSDQSGESDRVISSAMKDLKRVTINEIQAWVDGTREGGVQARLTAAQEGVALPMATSKWKNFTQADYDALYSRLAKDENGLASSIPVDTDAATAADLASRWPHVNLTDIE
ncbi:MAG: BMP family ABC transporter substrate-binding protein [Oscillospiraceae bacterium]|nr:BMP family ABC transporter substrate-binding protein [Oscillospiraceae bacterium]